MEARESVDYRIIQTVLRAFLGGSSNLLLAYFIASYLPTSTSGKSVVELLAVMLYPLALSLFVRRFSVDRLLVSATDIEIISFSELALLYPFFLTYESGVSYLVPNEFYLTLFYGVVMGWVIANALTAYTHAYPISAGQVIEQSATVPISLEEAFQHVKVDAVMKTFGFAPSLTLKRAGSVIFRTPKGQYSQLFLRMQESDVPIGVGTTRVTRVDLVGYHRGKYAAFKSDVVSELVRDKYAYLGTLLKGDRSDLALEKVSVIDSQRAVDDIILKKKGEVPQGISLSTLAILALLGIAEVGIPIYFFATNQAGSGLTLWAVNSLALALDVRKTIAERTKNKEKVG